MVGDDDVDSAEGAANVDDSGFRGQDGLAEIQASPAEGRHRGVRGSARPRASLVGAAEDTDGELRTSSRGGAINPSWLMVVGCIRCH